MGFGRAGIYSGHAHRAFCDIVFAPDGLAVTTSMQTNAGQLFILSPRTHYEGITTADFWFLKFSPDARPLSLPDKIDMRMAEGIAEVMSGAAEREFDWFPHPEQPRRTIRLTLVARRLVVQLGDVRLEVRS